MKIILTAALLPSGKCLVFKEDADLSQYDPEKLTVWEFETRPVTTGTLLKVSGRVTRQDLPTDAAGNYDRSAYGLAYPVEFCKEHVTKIRRGEEETDPIAEADIDAVPLPLLSAVTARADITAPATAGELAFLAKPASTGPTA